MSAPNPSDEYGRPVLYGLPAGPTVYEAASKATTGAELIGAVSAAGTDHHEPFGFDDSADEET